MQNYDPKKLSNIHNAANALARSETSYGTTPQSPPYLFSTENLADTYQSVPVKNKTLLTVAASGDHIFDAYLNGAKHVTAFDFNLMQECVMRMKTDLIHHMNYSQFMSFFFGALMPGRIEESYKIISPFFPKLSYEAQTLLHEFYNSPHKERLFCRQPFYLGGDESASYKENQILYFQSESNYRALQKILPEQIDFTLADAATVAQQDPYTYDVIHLSNIMSAYITQYDYQIDGCTNFFTGTLKPMMQKLNPNGTMIANYLWQSSFYSKLLYPYNETLSHLVRSQPNTKFLHEEFPSARQQSPWDHTFDSILIVQKTK